MKKVSLKRNLMGWLVGWCFSILFFALPVMGTASPSEVLEKANGAYQKAEYEAAETGYQSLVDKGLESANLYYNLGCCYYKQNEMAKAILWWERAARLRPNDADIEHNLQIANLQIPDKVERMPRSGLSRFLGGMLNLFSEQGWSVCGIVLCFLLFGLLAVAVLLGSLRLKLLSFYATPVLVVLMLLCFLFAHLQVKRLLRTDEAVVMAATVECKSSPSEDSSTLFVVHEGLKVDVSDQIGEWYEIRLPDGTKGWLETKVVEII